MIQHFVENGDQWIPFQEHTAERHAYSCIERSDHDREIWMHTWNIQSAALKMSLVYQVWSTACEVSTPRALQLTPRKSCTDSGAQPCAAPVSQKEPLPRHIFGFESKYSTRKPGSHCWYRPCNTVLCSLSERVYEVYSLGKCAACKITIEGAVIAVLCLTVSADYAQLSPR